ncbi:chlorophyllase [Streptomyces sp. PTM05]|uniref:Chlorophyllase n=1 Tax=Streptantibioticus parmotrematis TaxID=2873249 RepID=A0ABS7QX44_9ACTN|nr:chlorophyllase [Streptantibioticus parmotrematis]MBY8886349.1 chlorophyllase [Streptantibioticus parmotrematis]
MSSRPLGHQILSVKPLSVPAPDRGIDLQVKVTAPRSGHNLPVIVFSHGNAWSLDGYEPLVDRWAAAGFVVVQPTHLDSRRNAIGWDDPRFATIWRVRIADLHAIIDNLGDILAQAGMQARVDRERVAVVGHSWGAQTAGAVLGARVLDADGVPGEDFSHSAVSAGALIAATGTGDTLTPFAAENLPFMKPDFSTMATPALVVAGGKDQSQLSTRGPEWFTDAYHLSPAPKSLLTIADAEHTMGGIAGERVAETTDEDSARVVLLADAISAYLRAALGLDDAEWTALGGGAEDSDGTWSIVSK